MNPAERRATFGLAAIFGLRMLGLFLILPVFTLYGDELSGSTPMLVGLAIGAYGLTQALLQIPLGLASDRWGRRPVIMLGLLAFVAGSVLAAVSTDIYGVIAGRALQGAGAIAAAVMALAADLTRETQRTKAMAVIGISVGAAFMAALVIGPVVAASVGLSGVFWFTAGLAALAMGLMLFLVPPPRADQTGGHRGTTLAEMASVLRDPDLLRLDFGIFALHFILIAMFVALPVVLQDSLGVARADHWHVYVPVMLLSVVAMVPVIGLGERSGYMHRVLGAVVLVLAMADLALAEALHTTTWLLGALWLFFTAFNILEATLPSMVSKFAPEAHRGAALGVYSTSQFIGAFLGGVVGGAVFGAYGADGVFTVCALVAAGWFLVAVGLRAPRSAARAPAE
ncbi:MFS transporter [Ectothiorhodospiraceae bacterium WFHF3C12]|nr:MFS transporter [Ectothiorhodospiraceae bacterium WFHF3C12]